MFLILSRKFGLSWLVTIFAPSSWNRNLVSVRLTCSKRPQLDSRVWMARTESPPKASFGTARHSLRFLKTSLRSGGLRLLGRPHEGKDATGSDLPLLHLLGGIVRKKSAARQGSPGGGKKGPAAEPDAPPFPRLANKSLFCSSRCPQSGSLPGGH